MQLKAAVAATLVLPLLVSLPAAAEKATIRVGSVAPEGTPWQQHITHIKKRLEKASDGKLDVKLYLGGQKGDEKSLIRQTKAGRLQMAGVSTAALANYVPELQVLELPFLFESTDEADYVLDNYLYEPVQKLARKYGFVLYQWAENGWQNVGTKDRFIKSPDDFNGLKIRSQEAPLHLAMWKAFGASPVEMAVSEVLPALKTGLVEAISQTPLFTFAAGWHQGIQKYTVTKHLYQPGAIIYSKKFFDAQPESIQKILLSNVQEDTERGREAVRRIEPGLMQNFVNYGIDVYELKDSERKSFLDAAKKVRTEYLKSAPESARKLYAAIEAGKKAFRKQNGSE